MVLILNRIVIQSFAWIILATFLGTIMYLFWKVVEKFVENVVMLILIISYGK